MADLRRARRHKSHRGRRTHICAGWAPLQSPEEVIADDGRSCQAGVSPVQFDEAPIGALRAVPDYGAYLLKHWKPRVHEHLLRVTHLGGLINAAMSRPNQDLQFFTDQDEIASNAVQLTQLTELMMRVLSNCLDHNMRHLTVGTTKSDDGSLALEDLTAIADLAAGGAWELLSSTATAGWTPVKGIVTPFPRSISKKAQILGFWLADKQSTLQRSLLLFSKETNGKTFKIRSLEFEQFR